MGQAGKAAGQKYIVITSKHHDGFGMFDSKVSDYDIVDRTPFKRDPMKELSEACRREGVRLCFYYSQTQDWHHPTATGTTGITMNRRRISPSILMSWSNPRSGRYSRSMVGSV